MPIVTSNPTPARPRNFGFLKVKIARIVGGAVDPNTLPLAGEALNDRIIDLNSRLYECNKVTTDVLTVTSGVATLPTAFFKEIEFRLVDSSGNKVRQLAYIDWAEYQKVWNTTDANQVLNTPMYYTLFNIHRLGQLRVLPLTTDTLYVQGAYYQRFNLLVDDDDVLDAPQEVERALVLGAQASLLRTLAPESKMYEATEALAARAWDAFVVIDRKHEDNRARFRLMPLAYRPVLRGNQEFI